MSLNKNILYTFLTQFPTAIFNILAGIFLTRLLGVEGKGVYTIFLTNIQFLAIFFGLSVNSGLIYFIPKGNIPFSKLVGIALIIVLISSVIGALAIFPYTRISSFFFPNQFNGIIFKLYLYFSVILLLINAILNGIFQGLKRFGIVNRMAIINGTLHTVVFTVLFYFTKAGNLCLSLVEILIIGLALQAIVLMIWISLYIFKIRRGISFSLSYKKHCSPYIQYIIKNYLGDIISFLNYRIDIWFIMYYVGSEKELGYYSLAGNIALFLNFISIPLVTVLMPYFTSSSGKEKVTLLKMYSRVNATLCIGTGILFFMSINFLIPIIYGAEFSPASVLFMIIIPGYVFLCFERIYSAFLASENKLQYNLLASSTGLFYIIILNSILIPRFGVTGAAITISSALIIRYFIYIYLVHKKIGIPWGNYFFITMHDIRKLLKMK